MGNDLIAIPLSASGQSSSINHSLSRTQREKRTFAGSDVGTLEAFAIANPYMELWIDSIYIYIYIYNHNIYVYIHIYI